MADELRLVPDGENFILYAGQQSVHLTADQILDLSQSALRFREMVLTRHETASGTARPILVTPVENLVVWTDSMLENVLVSLATLEGGDVTFGFPPALARLLEAALPAQIQKIEEARPTRQ